MVHIITCPQTRTQFFWVHPFRIHILSDNQKISTTPMILNWIANNHEYWKKVVIQPNFCLKQHFELFDIYMKRNPSEETSSNNQNFNFQVHFLSAGKNGGLTTESLVGNLLESIQPNLVVVTQSLIIAVKLESCNKQVTKFPYKNGCYK